MNRVLTRRWHGARLDEVPVIGAYGRLGLACRPLCGLCSLRAVAWSPHAAASSFPDIGAEPMIGGRAMRAMSTVLRFQAPLRLQGRNSVRVIWTTREAIDWVDEAWDPDVRERLRLIGQSLRHAIDVADIDGADAGREALADTLIRLGFPATR